MKKTYTITALLCLSLSACATAPDPAKICTADWISVRSDKAVDRIEARSQSSLKAVRRVAQSWADGSTPGPFQLLALSNSVNKLKRELTNGQGVKDLRTLMNTCNDPEIITKAMDNLLERQNFPDSFQNMIDQNPIFQQMFQSIVNSAVTGETPQA